MLNLETCSELAQKAYNVFFSYIKSPGLTLRYRWPYRLVKHGDDPRTVHPGTLLVRWPIREQRQRRRGRSGAEAPQRRAFITRHAPRLVRARARASPGPPQPKPWTFPTRRGSIVRAKKAKNAAVWPRGIFGYGYGWRGLGAGR